MKFGGKFRKRIFNRSILNYRYRLIEKQLPKEKASIPCRPANMEKWLKKVKRSAPFHRKASFSSMKEAKIKFKFNPRLAPPKKPMNS